jgi:copper resistance protein C
MFILIAGQDAVKARMLGGTHADPARRMSLWRERTRRNLTQSKNGRCNLMWRGKNKPLFVAPVVVAALVAGATDVAAHARVKRASPAVGGAVIASAAPTELQVWFTERLEPALSTVEVVDSNGTRMDRGDVRIDPDDHTQLRVTLLPLPPGKYRVIWRVVSIDTHFRSGSFPFRVDP